MKTARFVGLALAAACAAQSCRFPAETIDCTSKDDCTAALDGVCESNRRCSYPDRGCSSGRRYGVYSTGAGQCVPADDGGAGGASAGGASGSGGRGAGGKGGSRGSRGGGNSVPVDGSTGGALPDGGEVGARLTIVAGKIGGEGTMDGRGSLARFIAPSGLAFDRDRYLYLADSAAHTIRRIDIRTARVTTVAGYPDASGYADGSAADARFDGPESVTFDTSVPDGPVLFITEGSGHRLRKLDLTRGTVSTVAGSAEGTAGLRDGIGTAALFSLPEDTVRGEGNLLYLADGHNNVIRSVDLASGEVKTIAGDAALGTPAYADGPAASARFQHPYGIAFDGTKKQLFISEFEGNRVRILDLATATVSTLVATGLSLGASLYFDSAKARLIVSSHGDGKVLAIDIESKTVTPLVLQPGPDDPGADVDFSTPIGIADVNGDLFVSDYGPATIRRLVPAAGGAYETTTFAGLAGNWGRVDATGEDARFAFPGAAIFGGDSRTLYIVDEYNHVIRAVDVVTGAASTYAGDGTHGTLDGVRTAAHFHAPRAIAIGAGAPGTPPLLYVSEELGAIRKIDPTTEQVTTLYVGAEGADAWTGLVATPSMLYATDEAFAAIAQMPIAGGPPVVLVGAALEAGCEDGPFALARFGKPSGLLWDGADALLVADAECQTIRRVDMTGKVVETIAGGGGPDAFDGKGLAARFMAPRHLSWTRDRLAFFVGDRHVVRRVDAKTFEVSTFAGSPDDFGGVWLSPLSPRLNRPNGLAEGPGGELYITSENSVLRYDPGE